MTYEYFRYIGSYTTVQIHMYGSLQPWDKTVKFELYKKA